MIFIGAELSDPHAHFVTNIVACMGSGEDLIIDLLKVNDTPSIFQRISTHLEIHQEQYVIYNAYTDEDFFLSFKKTFPELKLITVFSDDEWRHGNYDRYVALYADIFTIAVKDNLDRYKAYGIEPFYMQWACNPEMFHPLENKGKDIDVSFIGAAYGQRLAYIRFLIANGIKVKVFGKGWDQYADTRPCWGGYVSHKDMLEVISRSKINLNFLWTSAEKDRCTIKARTLELSACKAFQLSNPTDEFLNYGFVDKENIAVFHDMGHLLKQVRYYLQLDEERDNIAQAAYEHVLKEHTWKQRFQSVFEHLERGNRVNTPIHHQSHVLIVARRGVQHQIVREDERTHIKIMTPSENWQQEARNMDGVVFLEHDSTLNNESLYMMLFGLMADQSEVIAANFYTGNSNNRYWIRFVDRIVEKKRKLLGILPLSCFMFSGECIDKYGKSFRFERQEIKISYLEHPSFEIQLPYYLVRKLRLYFAYHGDSRKQFKTYLGNLKFGKAISLGLDKVWQKYLLVEKRG